MRLLFGEIAGKAKIRYPHVPIFIQEDIRRLKGIEVQESPIVPKSSRWYTPNITMDGMTFTGYTPISLHHGHCDLYKVYPYVITGNSGVLKPR